MISKLENRYIESSDDEEIHFAEYLAVVLENWRMIAIVAFVVLVLGTIYAFLGTPSYRADALIQVEDSAGVANDALGELASLFDTKATAAGEIELIRSRLVVGETVRRLHLDITAEPRHFPLIGAWLARRAGDESLALPLLGLNSFAWGGEKINVSKFEVPTDLYKKKFSLVTKKDQSFDLLDPNDDFVLHGKLGVLASGKTSDGGAVSVKVDTLVAGLGTRFVLTRASTQFTINKLQDDITVLEKTKQSDVIGASLDGRDPAITAATVNMIAQLYVRQNVDRKSAEAEHTLAFLDQQLPQLRAELDAAEERYNAFRNKKGTVDLSAESKLLLQQIVDSKTRLIELQQQKSDLVQRFTESHPSVVGLNLQISALEKQQEDLSSHVSSLPDMEQAALRLLRDVRVDTELYTNLLNSAQQLKIVKASQVGNVRVVDYAVAAEEPVWPKKPLVIALSLVLGVALGTMAAFARKALFGGVEHSEEIESSLGIPVYAIVPHSEQQLRLQRAVRMGKGGRHVLADRAPDDVAIESIRSLRTALQFALLDASNNIVMVTGPRPEVGKSFMSVNLAAVLASAGQKVLLVDADMRRGDANAYFGISQMPGLSDVIAGHDVNNAIVRNALPNLDILPKGSLPPNPAELLMSGRFAGILDSFKEQYDIVIVDTPPVLAVTDAALIGRYAGATLLVLRHGRHPITEISETIKRLKNSGVQLKGALFTDVPRRRIGYDGQYSGYYGYESQS